MTHVFRALAVIVAAASVWAQAPTAIRVTAARANIRATPAADAPVIEQVTEGAYLELLKEEGAWFQVRVPPNPRFPGIRAVGYVSKTVARLVSPAEAAAAAADAARRPIVTPPGGTVAIAADHSGKTAWLKAAATRAVAVTDTGVTPTSAPASPALLVALGEAGADSSGRRDALAVVTWVWTVAADAPAPVLTSRRPSFFVSYGGVPGLDPNEWTPGVVRLQPVEGTAWRIVSAASGPADARTRGEADWAVLRDLSERSARISLSGTGPGIMRMTLNAPLEPGEYAVVLRPVYAARQYTGRRLLGNEGEGVAFGAVWVFGVR